MWRLKQFMPKEQTGLEGRSIDIGNLKIHIRNAIAEGGFSCVYLARDVMHMSKQYALKHIICNDEESVQLVMKEIAVMKSLKGHPNVVTLCTYTILDMGRTKEALLVMEYCENSLVSVLESRGAGYFEEKQVLVIFRDICNAVHAMHCQSPSIAHRDLKAENLLLGSDGLWKLCDFGSTSTNHKRFEKPEEMGIEEDNIRKHTTPAYRAPEMWDLFRKEVISEKVDIWALGCLLFRICYFKSAFDGESKLQVLNGNYRLPELPKYSSAVTDLIKDMLQASPDSRPDITQVWFRVNEQLPAGLQKSLPDRPPEMHQSDAFWHERGFPKQANRSPPPPPSSREPPPVSRPDGGGGALGAFWSTQHAKDAVVLEDRSGPKFDEVRSNVSSKHDQTRLERSTSPPKEHAHLHKNPHGKPSKRSEDCSLNSKDFKMRFYPEDISQREGSKPEVTAISGNEAFNSFAAEFDVSKFSHDVTNKHGKEQELKDEVERLKEQLKQANLEKMEITSKYEKLSAICRSQRQEIQELKQIHGARTPLPNRDALLRNQKSPGMHQSATPPRREKVEDAPFMKVQQGNFDKDTSTPGSKPWKAFVAEDPKPLQPISSNNTTKSVGAGNGGHANKPACQGTSGSDSWGFGTDSFTAISASCSPMTRPTGEGSDSQRFGELKTQGNKATSQPAGWAGF